ncbi:MAG: hypothetical protein M1833_003941 [Piccolia ochrophora]|nr:MAG: hypothetical protein M1833_003941 [Piccolia ochrophora]
MATTSIKAKCHCGKNEIPLDLPTSSLPLPLLLCHCDSSRHVSGALFTGYAALPDTPELLKSALDGNSPLHLTSYDSSEAIRRFFCSTCGAHMVACHKPSGKWKVANGVLDKIEGIIEVKGHMWVGDTKDGGSADWMIEMGGKQMERRREGPESEQLPLGWKASIHTDQNTAEDRLRGRCHCGGVDFYVSRPNESSKNAHTPYPDLMAPNGQPHLNPRHESWWLSGDGSRYAVGTCACDSCRLVTGFPIATWLFVPLSNVSQSDGSPMDFEAGTLTKYVSSPIVQRYFCGKCGATAFWDSDERTALIDVGIGLLRAAEGARAERWLEWWTSRVSFEGDAIDRALVESLQRGIGEWGRKHHDGDGGAEIQ